ncbi:hypothetical protein ACLB2K_068535 [Fragaria x ananassa]
MAHFLQGGSLRCPKPERYESGFIHDIVGEILAQVPNTAYLNVADYPVGLESRVLHVNMLLDVEEKDVRMVGIWGTGGIGKTTVAKAVYNSIVDRFEGSCFLENVRENSMKDGGLVELQNTILFDILGEKRLKVNNADRGINVIKKMLSHKRVLLVLDDVNHFAQLNHFSQNLHNVKSINFRGCKLLKSIPDFSGIPNLVYLNLNYCKSLVAVHPSVGFLKRLVHLSADKCSSLVMFPPRDLWKFFYLEVVESLRIFQKLRGQ